MIAALITTKQKRMMNVRFSTHLVINTPSVAITSWITEGANQTKKVETISLEREVTSGDLVGTWTVPAGLRFGDVENAHVLWLTLTDKNESFPVDFRFPVYKTLELAKAAGAARTIGRSPLDPVDARARSRASGDLIQKTLMDSNYGAEWTRDHGQTQLHNDSIHGLVRGVKTAVGGGNTWLVERGPNSTFKNLYTCFDARNFLAEKASGVPSGGGWHEIGDAAETIINNLEDAPILVGYASGAPELSAPDGKSISFGNRDVSSVRFLRPDEAMMTGAGKTTWEEDRDWRAPKKGASRRVTDRTGAGRNYHWFLFQSENPVCTQEWVHPCLPKAANNFGLEPKSDAQNCNLEK